MMCLMGRCVLWTGKYGICLLVYQGKVQVILPVPQSHTQGADVQLYSLLTLAQDGDE
jgi:hypothetical protein